jgi:hypothetical protein
MSTERKPVEFPAFGGLRLDVPIDEVSETQAIYLRDVDWDGPSGRIRPRDGFAKLKAADASGPYKGLFAHSNLRLLATKRISGTEVKIVAIDKDGEEQDEGAWPSGEATSCFTRFGTPSDSYTYCRANITTAKVVRFDGTAFTEPTATVDGVAEKEMPRGKIMLAWPDGGDRLIVLNTAATGGPGGAASSNSHGWFSEAEGKAEDFESTAYIQFSPGDGEEITDGQVFGGMVFVFKETKFFVVYGIRIDEEGRPIFDYREVSLGEGSRMKRPVIAAQAESSDRLSCVGSDGVYFCTSDGVYLTTGGQPSKISQALRPLEEVSPFDGPMAEFLNGDTEVFRWPATGIACLGSRLIVRRFEFMFVLDLPTGEWTCWKMPAVSMAIWTGLTGGGSEVREKLPGKVVSEGGEGGGTLAWSNPENAKVSDEAFATVERATTTGFTQWLKATQFGFAVPSAATIIGIQLAIQRKQARAGEGNAVDRGVRLVKAGTVMSTADKSSAAPWPLGDLFAFYGGPEDLWGTTWTPEDVNAVGFGAALVVALNPKPVSFNVTAYVDCFQITVYYLTAEAASGVRPRLYCTQSKSVFVTNPGAPEEGGGDGTGEWQSGFYDLGLQDEKALVGVRAFGAGTIDAQSFTDLDPAPDISGAHLEFPASGRPTVLDTNALTTVGVMFSHRVTLQPGSRLQRLVRYLDVTLTPLTKQ